MKIIKLSNGLETLIDDTDVVELSRFRWRHNKNQSNIYAIRCGKRGEPLDVQMHRQIMNPPKALLVDHIDGNGLNNQRNNLRIVTRSQNLWNSRKLCKTTSSKYKGVSWAKWPEKWQASIRKHGKQKSLGAFVDEIEAAKAYDKAALELFGEFALINFP